MDISIADDSYPVTPEVAALARQLTAALDAICDHFRPRVRRCVADLRDGKLESARQFASDENALAHVVMRDEADLRVCDAINDLLNSLTDPEDAVDVLLCELDPERIAAMERIEAKYGAVAS